MNWFIFPALILLFLLVIILVFKLKKINNKYRNLQLEKSDFEDFLLDLIPKPIFIINIHGICLNVNKEFEKFFDVEKNYLKNKSINVVNDEKFGKLFKMFSKELTAIKKYGLTALVENESEITFRSKNFNYIKLKIYKSYLFNRKNQLNGIVGVVEDITEYEKQVNKLMKVAIYDDLTGIYNRGFFNKTVKDEIERVKRYDEKFSMILFDIDYFKNVNDTYGHDMGDYVLREISKTVDKSRRNTDKFFRVGGEEFALLLFNTDLENAAIVAEKMRQKVENMALEKVGRVTISAGVTQCKGDDNFETLYKRSDEALYKAKNKGRNRVETYY